jgi:hypothetical protein
MAAVNRKYLHIGTGLRYLRNSKGYKAFMDAELNGPTHDLTTLSDFDIYLGAARNSKWRP